MEGPNVHSRISGKLILMNIIKKFRLAWYITDNYLAYKCLPHSIILETWTEMAAININISVGAALHLLGILLSIFPTKGKSLLLLLLLLLLLSSSSSSSSSSPLCRVFTLIFLRQTMSLGNRVLQLFCCYYSWCFYR